MKKIGLVGGTGPESTLMYYKELNTRIDQMTYGRQMPEIVIESVDFRKAWEFMCTGQYDLLGEYLAEKVNRLKNSGAEVIALTAGTMHVLYQDLVAKTQIPLVSIPQAVAREAKRQNFHKVALLGTAFTMEQDYMKQDFREAGIQVCVPEAADRELIARRIFEELENGIVKESTLKEFQDIIRKMQIFNGVEAVVLGCTELPLLLNSGNCPVPCLDSVDIHINELIRLASGQGVAPAADMSSVWKKAEIVFLTPQISIDRPENAVYRKTTRSNDGNGGETQKDYFYDKYDNPICLVDTTLLQKNPNSSAGAVIRRSYQYNEDGTISEQTTSGDDPFGKVTTSRFTYNSNKKVLMEHRFEDGRETGTITYDYDSHDNPSRVSVTSGDNLIRTTQGIKSTYDPKGRVSYKEMLYHSGNGAIKSIHTWYEYDDKGNMVLEKSQKAGETQMEYRKNYYDGSSRLIKSVRYVGDQLVSSETYEYEFF
ncbi:MAG: amino acid racemase [Lachnospiraceae bacterium]|nr:amino acid racemase [Lachnospiraceae bacterium]